MRRPSAARRPRHSSAGHPFSGARGERCLWVTSDPAVLRRRLGGGDGELEAQFDSGQIDIVHQRAWHGNASLRCLEAVAAGYRGLRVASRCACASTAWCAGCGGTRRRARRSCARSSPRSAAPSRWLQAMRLAAWIPKPVSVTQLVGAVERHRARRAAEVVAVATGPGVHSMQFYGSDQELAVDVAGFLAPSVHTGDAAIVIATGEHWQRVESELAAAGCDPAAARARGALRVLDARETLDSFLRRGRVDEQRFTEVVGPRTRRRPLTRIAPASTGSGSSTPPDATAAREAREPSPQWLPHLPPEHTPQQCAMW